jgi:hypothetical protein
VPAQASVLRSLAITALLCVLAELAAFAGLVIFDIARGEWPLRAITRRLHMHPLVPKSVLMLGAFDPLVAQRLEPNSKIGNVRVNRYGFVANGPDDASLGRFPLKAENEIRIVMLGSSILAGSALRSDESHTISAYLERSLNSGPKSAQRYTVLNFGVNGGYSFSELRTFFAQVIYLEPDIVVALDGWSDAMEGAFNAERSGLRHGLINWSELSYRHNELFNRIAVRRDGAPYVFTYIYLALRELGILGREATDHRQERYEGMPWYRISGDLIADRKVLEFVLPQNVEAMAAYSNASGFCFIGYLQPYADFARMVNEEEQAELDAYHTAMANAGHTHYARATYSPTMKKYFSSYKDAYRRLSVKYAGSKCARFFDITGLFEKTPERVYLDPSHYNERGNEIVAGRMADDIRRVALR